MAFVTRSFSLLKLREVTVIPAATAFVQRLHPKRISKRKPRWLPMAKTKVFRIPVHPYVPPEEKELILELLDEYTNKFESLRAMYKKEVDEKSKDDDQSIAFQEQEEKKFQNLLEENKKENERVRVIREEMLENLFQEKKQTLLQQFEELKAQEAETRERVDEIVRKEKEKYETFVTLEILDNVIEKALDAPVNVNFAIALNGGVKWEGKPPLKLEEELKKNIGRSLEA